LTLPDNIKSFYKCHHGRGIRPNLNEYMTVLRAEIGLYSKVYIVVDALDECSEEDCTRKDLLQLLRYLSKTVNLLVTSRNIASIARDFEGVNCLNIHANEHDIRKYVEARIPHEPRLARHINLRPRLKEKIMNKIIMNVKGM
jgi:hypothetical protein